MAVTQLLAMLPAFAFTSVHVHVHPCGCCCYCSAFAYRQDLQVCGCKLCKCTWEVKLPHVAACCPSVLCKSTRPHLTLAAPGTLLLAGKTLKYVASKNRSYLKWMLTEDAVSDAVLANCVPCEVPCWRVGNTLHVWLSLQPGGTPTSNQNA